MDFSKKSSNCIVYIEGLPKHNNSLRRGYPKHYNFNGGQSKGIAFSEGFQKCVVIYIVRFI